MKSSSIYNMKILTISVSGPTCSGKTTLAALLETILPDATHGIPVLIVNADTFFKPVEDLPIVNGIPDNDDVRSVDNPALSRTIDYVKAYAELPATYQPYDFIKVNMNTARRKLSTDLVAELRERVLSAKVPWSQYDAVLLVEGFLLYHNAETAPVESVVFPKFDVKLFTRASREASKRRRNTRYAEQPPDAGGPQHFKTEVYFDRFVWGHFTEYHGYLFDSSKDQERLLKVHDGDLDVGRMREEFGVLAPGEVDLDIDATLRWAVGAILGKITEF